MIPCTWQLVTESGNVDSVTTVLKELLPGVDGHEHMEVKVSHLQLICYIIHLINFKIQCTCNSCTNSITAA